MLPRVTSLEAIHQISLPLEPNKVFKNYVFSQHSPKSVNRQWSPLLRQRSDRQQDFLFQWDGCLGTAGVLKQRALVSENTQSGSTSKVEC